MSNFLRKCKVGQGKKGDKTKKITKKDTTFFSSILVLVNKKHDLIDEQSVLKSRDVVSHLARDVLFCCFVSKMIDNQLIKKINERGMDG